MLLLDKLLNVKTVTLKRFRRKTEIIFRIRVKITEFTKPFRQNGP